MDIKTQFQVVGRISINQVLAEMTDISEDGGTFSISFVRATGKNPGSIKTIDAAQKGGGRQKNKSAPRRKKTMHRDRGTIPITDINAPAGTSYHTILISHMIIFNGQQIIH